MTDKNFDAWNKQKKATHLHLKNKWVHTREVWWVEFGTNIGTEMDGRGKKFLRPALILKTLGFTSALVVPLTSRNKVGIFYVQVGRLAGEIYESVANLGQIRVIDTKRCVEKMGQISPEIFSILKKSTQDFLE